MKKNKILKLLPYIALAAFLIYAQGGTFLSNFNLEDTQIPSTSTSLVLNDQVQSIIFPPAGRSISLFWHSQCAPCKLEMIRLKKSVENKKIDPKRIFAINPFESELEIKKHLRKNPFPFVFIRDNGISELLNIKATPTSVFIEDNKIKSIKTGMSILGIWLAQSFI